MKVLGRDLEASAGDVMLQAGMRLGKLNQNQFGYEESLVIDVVMSGHAELWAAMKERDRIYADPNATDDDYMKAADLESVFAEYGGYDAEARAASILTEAGIAEARHHGLMREVPPGLKLRVLLAQALFSKPDVLLLDEPTNNLDINSIRWLEGALNNYDATMVIISHDRHFLNQVCTHIADLDFQQLKIYPGNYDDFMLASIQARQRVEAANAKAKERISDLQEFVRRFSANASKARQATSRKRQLEKIKIEEIRPSSRQNPYIRFEQGKKLYRNAVTVEKLTFTYPGATEKVLDNVSFNVEAGERIAIIGPNGVGKTTLMRCLAGELRPDAGRIVWVENAQPGYMPQDPQAEFEDKIDLFSWMSQYTGKADDDQIVRATLGRLLFSGDETKKSVKVLSGGEKGRMIYGKLILTKPNVLVMDEPTNHMDMETIESLQIGLEHFAGTLLFVSHDREFVGGLATRILELRPGGSLVDFRGTYDEYLKSQGIEVQ
jgi:ATPase subunit of ABC transporter with duplicated ATPase domains